MYITMTPYKRIKALIYNISEFISYQHRSERSPLCNIEGIDLFNKKISIHCKGVRTPIMLTFDEIINDSMILANLAPKHATWVGYYYGKYYYDLIRNNAKYHDSSNLNFSINSTSGKFKLVMLTRNRELIYHDQNDHPHVISPIKAATQNHLISRFDPIQACYIGILAGASHARKQKLISKKPLKNTQLHLVK